MFWTKHKIFFEKITKFENIGKSWIMKFWDVSKKNIFCFVQEHIEKIKIFKIKNYFYKLLILNRYVSNLQVPTTSESPWGKVNVSKFMDFGEIRLMYKKKDTFGTIKKNNCYIIIEILCFVINKISWNSQLDPGLPLYGRSKIILLRLFEIFAS